MVEQKEYLYKKIGLFVLLLLVCAGGFSGCSTDVVPEAPEPESRTLPVRDRVSTERFLTVYSRDFETVYKKTAPWTNYMIVYLSVHFLARDGLTEFRELSQEKQDLYPGVQLYIQKLEEKGGPWRYTALQTLETMRDEKKRESFRSKLNFAPFQHFAIGKWLKNRLMSDRPLPDFEFGTDEKEFNQPILKSMGLVLAAQYYLTSYQVVTEPTVLEDYYNRDMSWIIEEWKTNYLRVRSIWKPKFDLTVLSTHTLRPLYEPAEEQPAEEFWTLNPAERNYGRSTLPFNDVQRVPVNKISSRIRDLQTKAIQEFIENRLHSSLRGWLQCLTYALKYRLYEQLTGRKFDDHSDINFYARNALQDIHNIIKLN